MKEKNIIQDLKQRQRPKKESNESLKIIIVSDIIKRMYLVFGICVQATERACVGIEFIISIFFCFSEKISQTKTKNWLFLAKIFRQKDRNVRYRTKKK